MAHAQPATSAYEGGAPKKKVLMEMVIKKAKNGGHVITHHFSHHMHEPEHHAFGPDESAHAHQHIADAMQMPMEKNAEHMEDDGAEEETED